MRVAALYDVHGNLPALEAVLEDVERAEVDVVVVGGDVASGPMPAQTLDRLATLGERARYVRGNADRELLDAYERFVAGALEPTDESVPSLEPTAAWAAQWLRPAHRELLATFKLDVRVGGAHGEILFCHGTPRSDEEIVTAATSDAYLAGALAGESADVIVAGHTHVQLDRKIGAQRFVNAGSVGMPYEDEPGAYWALVGDDELELRRTSYDYTAAAEAIKATGFPAADELVRECLLEPVGSAAATSFFHELASKRRPPPR